MFGAQDVIDWPHLTFMTTSHSFLQTPKHDEWPCRVLTVSVVRVEKTDDSRGGGEYSSKRAKVNTIQWSVLGDKLSSHRSWVGYKSYHIVTLVLFWTSDIEINSSPRMENNSYASTAGGTSATTQSQSGSSSVPLVAETGEPVPENQLKPVHSNYVPAQVCTWSGPKSPNFDLNFW